MLTGVDVQGGREWPVVTSAGKMPPTFANNSTKALVPPAGYPRAELTNSLLRPLNTPPCGNLWRFSFEENLTAEMANFMSQASARAWQFTSAWVLISQPVGFHDMHGNADTYTIDAAYPVDVRGLRIHLVSEGTERLPVGELAVTNPIQPVFFRNRVSSKDAPGQPVGSGYAWQSSRKRLLLLHKPIYISLISLL